MHVGSLLPGVLTVCWAQPILGLVGLRVVGSGLGWWWLGLLWALCGLHVPHGHPTVSRWVRRAHRQAQVAPTEGSHWRKIRDQAGAKFTIRMDLFNLLSETSPKWHVWPLWFHSKLYRISTTVTDPEWINKATKP